MVYSGQNKGDHTSIEIVEISDESKSLASSLIGKLDKVPPSPCGRCCIYKVPKKVHNINEHAYTPELVCIGPFHRDKVVLQAMEEHKLRYMNALLSRTENLEAKLEECVESISRLEEQARQCYSEHIDLDKTEFIEMMMVDGLFIIELFCKSVGGEATDRDDPIFNNTWAMSSLVRDMILLENQLPMLVLNKLFTITMGKEGAKSSLNELAIRFFNPLMPRDEKILQNCFNKEGQHLLDLIKNSFHDLPPRARTKNSSPELKYVPCVSELRLAGVKFRKRSDSSNFLDIKFSRGVLEIPPILIQDQTDTFFRNLIVSEQYCDGCDTYMTSYAFLMDSLINSANDVAFLREKGIITNYLGNDECVSSLFNKLCSEVTLINFYYYDLYGHLNTFYRNRLDLCYAKLMREYLRSPWKVITASAAILLLLLTLASTIFSAVSIRNR